MIDLPRAAAGFWKLVVAPTESWLLAWVVVLALSLILCMRAYARKWRAGFWASAATSGVAATLLAAAVGKLWPLESAPEAWLRAAAAIVGIAALLQEARLGRFGRRILIAAAVFAFATYLHLGAPQFYSVAEGRPTWVHLYDLRVYFPQVKYFGELGYDGVYFASLAALVEERPEAAERLVPPTVRDLESYELLGAAEALAGAREVRSRFSPDRWRAFKSDMRWFWESMGGRAYLGSMRDHGANAPPAWVLTASLLFARLNPSETAFRWTGMIDLALVLGMFAVIGRTFGGRTAWIAMLIFGATDFPVTGSNWVGSTLRYDWLVLLGLSSCAWKGRRPVLAGALLGASAMLRGFPALAIVAVGSAAVLGYLRRREWDRSAVRGLVAAGLTGGALFAMSSAYLGFERSWGAWVSKIALHSTKPALNAVGLRPVLAFESDFEPRGATAWEDAQRRSVARRKPLLLGAMAGFAMLAGLALYRAGAVRAAGIGLLMVPILMYPTNYYCHFIALIPLAAQGLGDREWALRWTSVVLLALCVAQALTYGMRIDLHFYRQSQFLVAAVVALYLVWAWDGRGDRSPATSPGLVPGP